MRPGEFKALSAVVGAQHFKMFHLQDCDQVLTHLGLVFDNEDCAHDYFPTSPQESAAEALEGPLGFVDLRFTADFGCARWNNGIETVTVVPRPGWLSNEMEPLQVHTSLHDDHANPVRDFPTLAR
jgi:hypothetical protein